MSKKTDQDIITDSITGVLTEDDAPLYRGTHGNSLKNDLEDATWASHVQDKGKKDMESRGAYLAHKINRHLERIDSLQQKHWGLADHHEKLAEDPKHPKHKSKNHHELESEKHNRKAEALGAYSDAFRKHLS